VGLVVLQTVRHDTQRQGLRLRDRLVVARAVRHHARQLDDLGEPAAVGLLLGLDVEHGHLRPPAVACRDCTTPDSSRLTIDPHKERTPGVATPGGPRSMPRGVVETSMRRQHQRVKNSLQMSTFCRLLPHVLHHRRPVGEALRAEVDELALERPGAPLLRAVVDEEVAAVEVLVMRQDEPLVRDVVEGGMGSMRAKIPGMSSSWPR